MSVELNGKLNDAKNTQDNSYRYNFVFTNSTGGVVYSNRRRFVL